MKNPIHLVIRSASERTIDLCLELAVAQLPPRSEITVLAEVPFENALRHSYQAGLKADCKWTMTLDADVLLLPNAINKLLEEAEQMPSYYLQIEGRIFDKITGIYRQAGHRIYRTELLALALQQIPEPGMQIRPEFFTLMQMGQLGYPSRRAAPMVGLHDYEQYYFDLYRKSVVHSKKHSYLVAGLIERCARQLHEDPDFLIILKGLWDGLTLANAVSIDRRLFIDQAAAALEALRIDEKAPIENIAPILNRFPRYFEDITAQYPIPEFKVIDEPMPKATIEPNATIELGWLPKTQQRMVKHGPIRGSIASFGALLRLMGQRLDR